MKTKLTLTVHKSVINTARKRARKSGKSISGLFEEIFEEKKFVDSSRTTTSGNAIA